MLAKIPKIVTRVAGVVSLLFLVSAAFAVNTPTVSVNCDQGQTLNGALSKLNKLVPTTVTVQGTCTEFVSIDGFNGLTLQGQSGATLAEPPTNPGAAGFVLSITGSRGITVTGMNIFSLPSIFSGIGIGKGSSEILVQDVSVTGSWGVVIYEESQVWLEQVNVTITSGFGAISAFDKSDVHISGGLLLNSTTSGFFAGIVADSGHVTMQGTTIRDFQQGISIGAGGGVDLVDVLPTAPTDVTIDNPSGGNINGAIVSGSSSLNLGSARLIIKNAGQSYGGTTGAVFITDGSTLSASNALVITGSQGQGVIVTNSSHATLAGSSISTGLHGGLVAANLSTIDVQSASPLTLVNGNTTDVFCDSNSYITGSAYLSGVHTSSCTNLLSGNTVTLP